MNEDLENPEIEPVKPSPNDIYARDAEMGWWWLWIFFFALFLFGGWGWWGWGWSAPQNLAVSPVPVIAPDPLRQYVGQEVSLMGEAVATHGAHAFTLEGNHVLGAGNVLVITRQPIAPINQSAQNATKDETSEQPLSVSVSNDITYKVVGHVRIFDRNAIEKELGVKLDDFDYPPYVDQAVVVADSAIPLQPAR